MTLGVSGKYRLERRLGGGGMAEVFAGSTVGAEGFSRKVAIKRVLPGFSDDPAFAQMFVAEAQISSRLLHPNIVSVLDFDRDAGGHLFLVMELVDGKDLGAVLASGPVPHSVAIYLLGEILRGLGFAHAPPPGSDLRGVVHRDVSPHNVLLSWEGAVKISDFGIAKVRAASAATRSDLIKGKPAYMSPEQANGDPLDGRSDLFSAGIILWEMLVGQRLFAGDDTRAVLAQVLFGAIPRPRAVRPDVPRDLERVTMKLLERDLPARYVTAEDALADLLQCAGAPRAGREALMTLLAERFPDAAPVRPGAARIRSLDTPSAPLPGAIPPSPGPIPLGTPTVPGPPAGPRPPGIQPPRAPAAPIPPGAPALPDLPAAPIAPPPSDRSDRSDRPGEPGLGTLRSAPTRTVTPRPRPGPSPDPPQSGRAAGQRSRLTRTLTPLALLIASGLLTFAIVSAARSPSPGAPRTDSRLGSATATATAPSTASSSSASTERSRPPRHLAAPLPSSTEPPVQPPVDPPTDPTMATLPSIPAGAGTPQKAITVQSTPPGHPGADVPIGTLRVVALPILTVTVDGTSYGDTPLTITLKPGTYRVRLQNVEHHLHDVVSVTITAHQTTTIDRMPR